VTCRTAHAGFTAVLLTCMRPPCKHHMAVAISMSQLYSAQQLVGTLLHCLHARDVPQPSQFVASCKLLGFGNEIASGRGMLLLSTAALPVALFAKPGAVVNQSKPLSYDPESSAVLCSALREIQHSALLLCTATACRGHRCARQQTVQLIVCNGAVMWRSGCVANT
jgi:hypothetical protein